MLTLEQSRAARALLRCSLRQLAEKAGFHTTTVERMERGDGPVGGTVQTLAKVQRALQDAVVAFTAQNGGKGADHSRSIRRRISASRDLGIASSAGWNVT